jgi:hypothetical protein
MGQTPDRDPGIRQEEAIDFEDQALDPTIIGRLQRNGAALLFKKDGGAAVDLSLAEADNKDVKVSSDDTTPGFLEDKIVAGGDLLKAVLNPGANELLQLTANIGTIFSADSINATTVLSTTSAVPQNAFLGEPRDHLIPATDGDYLVLFLPRMGTTWSFSLGTSRTQTTTLKWRLRWQRTLSCRQSQGLSTSTHRISAEGACLFGVLTGWLPQTSFTLLFGILLALGRALSTIGIFSCSG